MDGTFIALQSGGQPDPACDTVIAWTVLSGAARRLLTSSLPEDEAPGCVAAAGHCGTH